MVYIQENQNKKEEAKWQKTVLIIIMLLFSVSATAVSAYLYGKAFRDIFSILVIATACFGCVVFSLIQSDIAGTLHYDNGKHYARFVFIFIVGIVAGCLLPLLPDTGWVFPALALALTLFSNTVTGMVAYAGILGICVSLSDIGVFVYILYFLLGMIFSVLFEQLDEEYKTGKLIGIAFILYVTSITAMVVFQTRGRLEIEQFLIPVMNIFVTFLLILAVLRFYCATVVDSEKGKYLRINDQEFELLAKYKEENEELYYNAIHTAYFVEKAARLLNMDVDVAKNGGYYHRIIVAECKQQDISLEELCRKKKFPPKAVKLLQEYNYKSEIIQMRETAVVYIVDAVVSSLLYLIDKNPDNNIDYGTIASAIIKRKIDSGILNKSALTICDIVEMDKIFTGEKLYYDFLRRK